MNISQVFVSAALLLIGGSADETTTVAFLVLAPYGGSDSAERPDLKAGPAVIPAVRLAVDRINNRSDYWRETLAVRTSQLRRTGSYRTFSTTEPFQERSLMR